METPKPHYLKLKQYILRHITNGDWPPLSRVPSENDLVVKFGVSRMTVNRALRELVTAGLLVRHKLKNHGIKFVLELAPDLPIVAADAAQLGQALLNLVLNGVDAMSDGGTLSIRTGATAQNVWVELQDTGRGMTEEQQNRAFRSLLQTTKKHGTGIGLAIVSKIIEAHRGEITVKSAPGQGTSFQVLLPRS